MCVAPIGKDPKIIRIAAVLAARLRQAGIIAQSEIVERSLRKILEAQAEAHTSIVVILGEKELAQNSVRLKLMETGAEKIVGLAELETEVSKNL